MLITQIQLRYYKFRIYFLCKRNNIISDLMLKLSFLHVVSNVLFTTFIFLYISVNLIFKVHPEILPVFYTLNQSNQDIVDISFANSYASIISNRTQGKQQYYFYSFDINEKRKSNKVKLDYSVSKIREVSNSSNTQTNNSYLFVGHPQSRLVKNNGNIILKKWSVPSEGYSAVFGQTFDQYYQAYQHLNTLDLVKNYLNQSNYIKITIQNAIAIQFIFESFSQRIFLAYVVKSQKNMSSPLVYICKYSKNLQVEQNLTLTNLNPINMKIQVSASHFTVSSSKTIFCYIHNASAFQYQWDLLFNQTITDIKSNGRYLIVKTPSYVYQVTFNGIIVSGLFIVAQSIGLLQGVKGQLVGLFSVGGRNLYFSNVTQKYKCKYDEGCSCGKGFCFTNDSKIQCVFSGIETCESSIQPNSSSNENLNKNGTDINSSINITSEANQSDNVIDIIVQNYTANSSYFDRNQTENNNVDSLVNNIQIRNNAHDQESQHIENSCFVQNQEGNCIAFCSMSCRSCQGNPKFCTKCRSEYYDLQDGGKCKKSTKAEAISNAINCLNQIKIGSIQVFYFFIDKFQLYNYHQIQYDGSLQEILIMVDFSKQSFWNIIGQQQINAWIETPLDIPSYIDYTSQKFKSIQRKDSLFVQNTKDYFLIYFPITLLSFLLFNRLFLLLSRFKISSIVRIYYFWLQFWFVVLFQNLSTIWFFSIHELLLLFNFNFQMKMIRIGTLSVIGIIFIFSFSFYFLCEYFYKKLYKYFLFNLFRIKFSTALMVIRFVIKPMIQSTLNAMLSQKPDTLINSLILSQTLTLLIMLMSQFCLKINKVKGIWLFQCLSSLIFLQTNILINLKYKYFPQLQQLWEFLLKLTIYLLGTFIIFTVLYPFLIIILPERKKKLKIAIGQLEKIMNQHIQKLQRSNVRHKGYMNQYQQIDRQRSGKKQTLQQQLSLWIQKKQNKNKAIQRISRFVIFF